MGSIAVIAGAAAAAATRRANSHRSHSSGGSSSGASGGSTRPVPEIKRKPSVRIIPGVRTNPSICLDCEYYRMNTCTILQRPDGPSSCSQKFSDPRVYYGDSPSTDNGRKLSNWWARVKSSGT